MVKFGIQDWEFVKTCDEHKLVIIFGSKESNNPILDVSSLRNIIFKGVLISGGVFNFFPSSKKKHKISVKTYS